MMFVHLKDNVPNQKVSVCPKSYEISDMLRYVETQDTYL